MPLTFALVGNPNCGKTTIFNNLTGSAEYVGNWPGVTVEKKLGKLRDNNEVTIIDLPGAYSLEPHTPDEEVTNNFLRNEKPDLIINVVDASNIERHLFLTTQLLELKIPMLVVLNMMDVVKKRGDNVSAQTLEKLLSCKVIEVSATKETGMEDITRLAVEIAKSGEIPASFFEVKSTDKPAKRFKIVSEIVKSSYTRKKLGNTFSDKIDKIVTNPVFSIPILVVVMFLMYFVVIEVIGSLTSEGVDWLIMQFANLCESGLNAISSPEWIQSLVLDGIIGGVGSVLGFVPQMMFLFLFMSLLEDCGYMARVAFVMDRIFRKFGLCGKAFIPLIIASGCGVPGIMASRTIENEKDRRLTIMVTTFIPCGAKLPVIALFGGALFGGAWWMAPLIYFMGIAAVLVSGLILKRFKYFKGEAAPFIMELPEYHFPFIKGVWKHTWERSRSYIIKAGTVILLACVVMWTLRSFTWDFKYISGENYDSASVSEEVTIDDSMLASVGNVVAPVFEPLGFGNWQASVATITGFVAKENVVSTFGVIYGVDSEDGGKLEESLRNDFTSVSGLAFVIFNMLCAPCVAAIAAIWREMNSLKWTALTLLYQTGFAYVVAFLIYQIGRLIC